MAHPAFSALLNWQIGETKHQILILLGVDISSTYFYSHLLPSNKLDLIPMFYFVKWGQGGTREREKFCYQTNDAGLSLQVDVAHQKPFR